MPYSKSRICHLYSILSHTVYTFISIYARRSTPGHLMHKWMISEKKSSKKSIITHNLAKSHLLCYDISHLLPAVWQLNTWNAWFWKVETDVQEKRFVCFLFFSKGKHSNNTRYLSEQPTSKASENIFIAIFDGLSLQILLKLTQEFV